MERRMIHIYTANAQPARRFVDDNAGPTMRFRLPDKALVYCQCCNKKRIAINSVVHVFYDHLDFYCAPDKGCKSEKYLIRNRRDGK